MNIKNIRQISIIGGTSGFGKWLTEKIVEIKQLYNKNFEIIITGRDIKKGKIVANQYNVKFLSNNIEAVKDSDIVIVSVPINITLQVIEEIGPYIRYGAILADVTSIKYPIYNKMLKFSYKLKVLPTHPMFGPFVKSIEGQVVILTPPEYIKKEKFYIEFKNFLKNQGTKVFELTPKQHDQLMSIIQGLTHFSLFVIADSIRKLSNKFNDKNILYLLDNFTSPVYKILIGLVSRYMSQNLDLYADIQMSNNFNELVQKEFKKSVEKFYDILFSLKDKDKFINRLKVNKEFFGEYGIKGQKYTDKIIFLLSNQIKKLKENVGKSIKLQNIYSKEIKEGILEKFDNEKQ